MSATKSNHQSRDKLNVNK